MYRKTPQADGGPRGSQKRGLVFSLGVEAGLVSPAALLADAPEHGSGQPKFLVAFSTTRPPENENTAATQEHPTTSIYAACGVPLAGSENSVTTTNAASFQP